MEAIKNLWNQTRWYRILTKVSLISLVAFIVSSYYFRSSLHFFNGIFTLFLFCWLVTTLVIIVRILKHPQPVTLSENVSVIPTEFNSILYNVAIILALAVSWFIFLFFLFILASFASMDPVGHFFEKTLVTFVVPFYVMGRATYKTFVKNDMKVIYNALPIAFMILMAEVMVLGLMGIMPSAFVVLTVMATIFSFSILIRALL